MNLRGNREETREELEWGEGGGNDANTELIHEILKNVNVKYLQEKYKIHTFTGNFLNAKQNVITMQWVYNFIPNKATTLF